MLRTSRPTIKIPKGLLEIIEKVMEFGKNAATPSSTVPHNRTCVS